METTRRKSRIIGILYFVMYFVISMLSIRDFGRNVDEHLQRDRSLVSYKYINKELFNRDVPGLENYPNLDEFDHEYYGTAIQIPMVMVEDFFGFTLSTRQIYMMRHYMTFAVVFCGYICLYIGLLKVFCKKQYLATIIVIMISLYPRFYSAQFYDIKNMMFVGLSMITIMCLIIAVEKGSYKSILVFGCVSALATNCRIMGVIYPVVLVCFFLGDTLSQIRHEGRWQTPNGLVRMLLKCSIVIATFFLTWVIITPFAWNDPIKAFISTFKGFSHYQGWNSTMVFMGKVITCEEVPWYYLFVWFGISIPVTYILFFVIGNFLVVDRFFKTKNMRVFLFQDDKWRLCFLVLFWIPVLSVIILKSRIYIGWHHLWFVFVPFCISAGYGIDFFIKKFGEKSICSAVSLVFLFHIGWMIHNHPFEAVYFNRIGTVVADQFDRDELRASVNSAFKWIIKNNEGNLIIGGSVEPYETLTEQEKERITISDSKPDFIIDGFRNVIGNKAEHEGYKEVHYALVDGFKVYSVFQRFDM